VVLDRQCAVEVNNNVHIRSTSTCVQRHYKSTRSSEKICIKNIRPSHVYVAVIE